MKRNEWPTLGQLIDSGKKLIVFMDEGADGSVNFLLPQFEMVSFFCLVAFAAILMTDNFRGLDVGEPFQRYG